MNEPVELELLSERQNAEVVLDGVAVVALVHPDGVDARRLLEAVLRIQVVLAGNDAQLPGLVIVAAVRRCQNVTLKNGSIRLDRSFYGFTEMNYRAEKKSWYVVARNFFLLFLNFSAWPCLAVA